MKTKNELDKLIAALELNEVRCYGQHSYDELNNIYDNISTGFYQFESPDILLSLNNKTILIEAFEFNATQSNKKGSKINSEIGQIENDLKKYVVDKYDGELMIKNYSIEANLSSENYKNNLFKNFNNHANEEKIKQYENHYFKYEIELTKKNIFNKNIEFGLLIIDSYPLPTIIIDNNKEFLMHPLFLEEFKNILIKNKKIKHLFFLNENDQIPLSYYYNSKNNYEELDKLFIKENAKIKTISNNPNAIFFSLKIRK